MAWKTSINEDVKELLNGNTELERGVLQYKTFLGKYADSKILKEDKNTKPNEIWLLRYKDGEKMEEYVVVLSEGVKSGLDHGKLPETPRDLLNKLTEKTRNRYFDRYGHLKGIVYVPGEGSVCCCDISTHKKEAFYRAISLFIHALHHSLKAQPYASPTLETESRLYGVKWSRARTR